MKSKHEKAEFLPTRQTLLSRLKDLDDHESWRRFFDTYWKLIYPVATKARLQDTEAQDVLQETIISVSRNIGTFKYEPETCSFKTWFMRVTHSRISNQFRKRKKHAVVVALEELPEGRMSWINIRTRAGIILRRSGMLSGVRT